MANDKASPKMKPHSDPPLIFLTLPTFKKEMSKLLSSKDPFEDFLKNLSRDFTFNNVECSLNDQEYEIIKATYYNLLGFLLVANKKTLKNLSKDSTAYILPSYAALAEDPEVSKNPEDWAFDTFSNNKLNTFPQIQNVINSYLESYYRTCRETNKFTTTPTYHPIDTTVDLPTIESVLGDKYALSNYAIAFQMINAKGLDVQGQSQKEDRQIVKLMLSNVVYPITEDFMLSSDSKPWGKSDKERTLSNLLEVSLAKIMKAKARDESVFDKFNKANRAVEIPYDQILPLLIKKLASQGIELTKSVYAELISPYLSFNDVDKPFFTFSGQWKTTYTSTMSEVGSKFMIAGTIQALRNITLNKTIQKDSNAYIKTRGVNPNIPTDVVGFALFHNSETKIKDIIDNHVDYETFLSEATNKLLKNEYKDCYFYFGDILENSSKRETMVNTKTISLELYNDIKQIINDNIRNIADISASFNYDEVYHRLNTINVNTEYLLDKLLRYSAKNKNAEEATELVPTYKSVNLSEAISDEIYGVGDNVIKLKRAKIVKPKKSIIVDTKHIKVVDLEESKKISELASCQHYLTLENLSREYARRKAGQSTNYETLLYNFNAAYVAMNDLGEYICKSCHEKVDISHYVQEGQFDGNKQFIAEGSYTFANLAALPEYKIYGGVNNAIESLDTLIGKLAGICGLTYYTIKANRTDIIKQVIDMSIANNQVLKDVNYEERNKVAIDKYGLLKQLTDIYVYPFDNSIFRISSTSKDFYQLKKYNNEIIYCMIMLLHTVSRVNVLNLMTRKTCNYDTYLQNTVIFEKLKILVDGQPTPILNYPVLCYLLYVCSYNIASYFLYRTNTGIYENNKMTASQKKQEITSEMLHMIFTFVDLLNSMIENAEYVSEQTNYSDNLKRIFTVFAMKYSVKLKNIFSNNTIISSLQSVETAEVEMDNFDKSAISISLNKEVKDVDFHTYAKEWITGYVAAADKLNQKAYIGTYEKPPETITYQSLVPGKLMNCENGSTHNWKYYADTKSWKCADCGKIADDVLKESPKDAQKDKTDDTDKTIKARNTFTVEQIAQYYCKDGNGHNWVFDSKGKKCSNCEYRPGDEQEMKSAEKDKMFDRFFSIGKGVEIVKPPQMILSSEYKKMKAKAESYKFNNAVKTFLSTLADIAIDIPIETDKFVIFVDNRERTVELQPEKKKIKDKNINVLSYKNKETGKFYYYHPETYRRLKPDTFEEVETVSGAIPVYSIKTMIENLFSRDIGDSEADSLSRDVVDFRSIFCVELVANIENLRNKVYNHEISSNYKSLTIPEKAYSVVDRFEAEWGTYRIGFHMINKIDFFKDWIFSQLNDIISIVPRIVNMFVDIVVSFFSNVHDYRIIDKEILKFYNLMFAETEIYEPYEQLAKASTEDTSEPKDPTVFTEENLEDGFDVMYDVDGDEATEENDQYRNGDGMADMDN